MDIVSGKKIERDRIAAIFDIDGTLVPGPSLELRLLAHLAAKREIRWGAIANWLKLLGPQMFRTRRGNPEELTRSLMFDENKKYLAGVRNDVAEKWIEQRFAEMEFFSEALTMLDWHRRRGHAIVLVSGTLASLARAVGDLLVHGDEIVICATELEVRAERWTGQVLGEAICGPAKERALKRIAAERHFDLSRSYAYADSLKDRWLLGAVGHPTVVNSSSFFARQARTRGWRLASWNKRACIESVARSPISRRENVRPAFEEKLLWK